MRPMVDPFRWGPRFSGKETSSPSLRVFCQPIAKWLPKQPRGGIADPTMRDLTGFDLSTAGLTSAKLLGAAVARCVLTGEGG